MYNSKRTSRTLSEGSDFAWSSSCSVALKELECLNRSLQSKTGSVTGMLATVECVKKTLRAKRSDECFRLVYATACDMTSKTIRMPHIRRPLQRYRGNAAMFTPASAAEHYRVEYFKLLDAIDVQLTERFDQRSFDILKKLCYLMERWKKMLSVFIQNLTAIHWRYSWQCLSFSIHPAPSLMQ